jgi:hypothetical protein
MEKRKELVSAGNPVMPEHMLGHQPKLVTSDSGILTTDF